MGRRHARGLANAHKHARNQQMAKTCGEPACCGCRTPHRSPSSNDGNPVLAFSQPCDWQGAKDIEDDKCRAAQKSQLKVRQGQLHADLFLNQRQQDAVDDFEHIDNQQRAQGIGAVVGGAEPPMGVDLCSHDTARSPL